MNLFQVISKLGIFAAFVCLLIILKHLDAVLYASQSVVAQHGNEGEEDGSKVSQKVLNNTDDTSIGRWANSISTLQDEDANRVQHLFSALAKSESFEEIRTAFYTYAYRPLQAVCKVGKFFGGRMLFYGCFDGHKYVCLDDLYYQILKGECLIYSFGIADDWVFESAMAKMGCTVRAFDPTIDGSTKPESNLISFRRVGLSDKNGTLEKIGEVQTLQSAMASMNDLGKTISYLKVDVEGAELSAMQEWIDSGVLNHVSQFGLEIHTGKDFIKEEAMVKTLQKFFIVFQKLHQLGFRHISTALNDCNGRDDDLRNHFTPYFEMVFYKPSS